LPAQPEITYSSAPFAESVKPLATAPPETPLAETATPSVEPGFAAEPVVEQSAGAGREPAELPRTATSLPAVAVGGLASLLAGLGLALRRRWTA
jgi:LPXTG-motif cell wall-anchored protein